MKGANAVPSVKTINNPKNNKNKIIGVKYHFLRVFIKTKNSFSIESFDILSP